MEVFAPHLAVAGKSLPRHLPLVHPETAVGVLVHLLQQQQVRVQGGQGVQGGAHVGEHRFPAFRPTVHPPVGVPSSISPVSMKKE